MPIKKSKSYKANVKVVNALKEAGANFDKLHSIEHHFYCYSEAGYNQVITLGENLGYMPANEGKDEDENGIFWQLDLIKKSKPDIESIEKQVIEIEDIAEKSNADYDGWGTEIEE